MLLMSKEVLFDEPAYPVSFISEAFIFLKLREGGGRGNSKSVEIRGKSPGLYGLGRGREIESVPLFNSFSAIGHYYNKLFLVTVSESFYFGPIVSLSNISAITYRGNLTLL